MISDTSGSLAPNLLELVEARAPNEAFSGSPTAKELAVCETTVFASETGGQPTSSLRSELSMLTDAGGDSQSSDSELSLCADDGGDGALLVDPSMCSDELSDFTTQVAVFSFCADEGSDTPSDASLKTDIVRVGTTVRSLPLYHFRYKNGTDRFEGVMAQDVLHVLPEAVTRGQDGFYRVNYALLGIKMLKVH